MRRVSFRVPAAEKEELLDALMPLLPAGVRERTAGGDVVELTSVAAALPPREALEAAAGRELEAWEESEVPADWRERRALFGGGAFLVGGRLLVRSPWDPPAGDGVLDLVLERSGGGFGSGSHATTRMCLELLLEVALAPAGSAADLGCGLGTLAIAAARLGWSPVLGVDRMAGAVEAARANGARNEVLVDWRVADLEAEPVPLAELLLVNAPPPVHARVVAALSGADAGAADAADANPPMTGGPAAAAGTGAPVTDRPAAAAPLHIVVSGVVRAELDVVAREYAAAGWSVAAAREEDGWAAALLEPGGA